MIQILDSDGQGLYNSYGFLKIEKIKEKIDNQIKHFTRKLESLWKNQKEILEPKNNLSEVTNLLDVFSSRRQD